MNTLLRSEFLKEYLAEKSVFSISSFEELEQNYISWLEDRVENFMASKQEVKNDV